MNTKTFGKLVTNYSKTKQFIEIELNTKKKILNLHSKTMRVQNNKNF